MLLESVNTPSVTLGVSVEGASVQCLCSLRFNPGIVGHRGLTRVVAVWGRPGRPPHIRWFLRVRSPRPCLPLRCRGVLTGSRARFLGRVCPGSWSVRSAVGAGLTPKKLAGAPSQRFSVWSGQCRATAGNAPPIAPHPLPPELLLTAEFPWNQLSIVLVFKNAPSLLVITSLKSCVRGTFIMF